MCGFHLLNIYTKLLRVEEPLRRCWDKTKYLKDPTKRDKVPLGLDNEFKTLVQETLNFLNYLCMQSVKAILSPRLKTLLDSIFNQID